MINVSQPYLPPLEELMPYLNRIWQSGIVTNNGPLVQEFESELKKYTGVKHAFFVSNGTIALQIAIRSLDIKGKILITPFSAVATLSSALWERFVPVFADIDERTLNISPQEVKKKISADIGCIIATHVYGNSCHIEQMESIAKSHNIPLIFDASHAFGSLYQGRDIMNFGTISTLSLQAFKILHSVEGGFIFTNDDEIASSIFQMRYFGYDEKMMVETVGINGKTSEINAAMGLCVMNHFKEIKQSRLEQSKYYDQLLAQYALDVKRPIIVENSMPNNAYYAIILQSEADVMRVQDEFEKKEIQFKRYFHPSLNSLKILDAYEAMPVSESIASRVICLPLHFLLSSSDQDFIIASLAEVLN